MNAIHLFSVACGIYLCSFIMYMIVYIIYTFYIYIYIYIYISRKVTLAAGEGSCSLQTRNVGVQHPSIRLTVIASLLSDARSVRGLRSTLSLALEVTGCRLKTSERAFRHSAVAARNSLPSMVAECETVGAFRKQLKTHLYDVAYKTVWDVAPCPRMSSPHIAGNKFYVLTCILIYIYIYI